MRSEHARQLCELYGRTAVLGAVRTVIESHRAHREEQGYETPGEALIGREISELLGRRTTPSLRRMFNLTGIVLHTNLGRALLSESAIQHASMAMRAPSNLEFNLATGERGERDSLIENVLIELTGAEAATVVNNNAAAVLLVLAALAHEREVVLSRGEMVEIGGSFRIPDVMRSANTRLVEIGTTNRTHKADYARAIGPQTAALMKVHASNYKISGFVADVSVAEVSEVARAHGLPVVVDLGAGSLVDLSAYGLPKEPMVSETIAAGADIVTFSGDKLLGGPQAGLIVGRKALIASINRHPLKRALRVSKLTLAALEATLLAYLTPERLVSTLPTIRHLTRPLTEIEALAHRLQPRLAAAVGAQWQVNVVPMSSQVGSGSLPLDTLPSVGLSLSHQDGKSGSELKTLAGRLRNLPIPVIGRVSGNRLLLDLRCLDSADELLVQFDHLAEHLPAQNRA